jgi:hypothetical protein
MNWCTGKWSFKLSESIVAPTGGYDDTGSDLVKIHDFSADNRFESDYITLTVAFKF